MNQQNFKNKVAIITGAASGIGRETAIEFAQMGAKVCVADWDQKGIDETVKLIQAKDGISFGCKVDVSNESNVKEMVRATIEKYGKLDFAFNNAGIAGTQGSAADVTLENFNKVISINLTGVWLCMKYEITEMLKTGGGAIVNCASILGEVGFAGAAAYAASKHGVIGLTQAAAIDYAPKNIRINAVCPGFIVTPMLEGAGLMSDPNTVNYISSLHAMKRMGKSGEIASVVRFLCSEDASFITGQPILVDGGYTAM